MLGPLGVAVTSTGNVMVADYTGTVRVLSDVDGQVVGAANANVGFASAVGLTNLGGVVYMSSQNHSIFKMNNDGTINSTLNNTIISTTGITNNGVDIFADGNGGPGGAGIYRVNATSGFAALLVSGSFDGLTVDIAHGIIYAAASSAGHVLGYSTVSGALVFDSGSIDTGIDGIAIGQGTLAGNLFINDNNGSLYEFNLGTSVLTTIANGGSRGDFVAVDTSNGSLFITQSDRVLRLTAPSGGSFATPEPGTIVTMLGGVGLLALGRRKRGSSLCGDNAGATAEERIVNRLAAL